MPKLIIQFLGSPCFFMDGRPVRPGRRKAVALAAFLAVNGTPVSRERLAGLFWPDAGREKARASLRRTLSAMGKVLGKSWFAADRETVRFVPNETVEVDVLRFQTLASREGAGPETLEQAAGLYRGSFLSGFSLRDAPEFDDWQFARKEALEREYTGVLRRITRMHSDLGNDAGAIRHAVKWSELDPLNESAHRHLIRLFGRSGQTGPARRQYEKCRHLLEAELGISPARETAALARQVLHPESPLPQGKTQARSRLPNRSGPLIGRRREMDEITSRLALGKTRMLTLTGPGGIGKTRLAVEAAAALEHAFDGSLFFIPFADVTSEASMMAAISRALTLSPGPGQDIASMVINFLQHRKCLLVLDNLEHLPGAGRLISQMLDSAGQLRVLATSRSRLELAREHLLVLSGLPYPREAFNGEKDPVQWVKKTDGTALFLSAVRRVRPDFTPDADNINHILRICRLTSGIPLALILAGGWGDVFSARDMADEIEAGIDFLQSGAPDVPQGHRSMRAVFDTSWNRLDKAEQDFFMQLSVFRGRFTRRAADAVAGSREGSGMLLAALVRKSLVMTGFGTVGTYELHPLLIQYTGEKLALSGMKETTLDRHEHYYMEQVRTGEKELISPGMTAYRAGMDREFANIEQAWHRAVHRRDVAALSRSATALYIYFDMHTRYIEGERFFRAAKEMAAGTGPTFSPESGLILLCWFDMQVQGPNALKSFESIQSFAHKWLRWAVRSGDARNRAHALLLMGAVAHRRKRYSRAVRLYRMGLDRFPGVEHGFWVTIRMGLCMRAQGVVDRALPLFEKSLETGRALGDAVKTAWSLGNVGSAHLCLGNEDTAHALLMSAREAFEKIEAPMGLMAALEELGLIALFNGKFDRALRLSGRAAELAADLGLDLKSHQRGTALRGMAWIMAGNPERGRACFHEIEKSGAPGFTACLGMSFYAALNKNPVEAAHFEKAARTLAGTVHKPQFTALLDLARAAALLLDNDETQAAESIKRAVGHPHCPGKLISAWEFSRNLTTRIR